VLFVCVGFVSADSFAQRRKRGSVRYSRPDGTVSGTTRRGTGVQSNQTTEGDRRTTQTTATGRGGETVTGTREVTREDDKIKVESEAQASTGASRERSTEIEVDEGRVESVERKSQTTGRGGETLEREGEIEREGYGRAEFEGEAKTSTGREAEVEGVAGYGSYGRRGVVANVDTKYRGDWNVAAGRGPYGGAVARLPEGYRPYSYYGRRYYYYGAAFYRPYTWRGTAYYFVIPPPYGVVYTTVPVGATVYVVAASTYYYSDHVCYKQTSAAGSVTYEVVPAPAGLQTTSLPPQAATVTVGGTTYHYYKNTFYREVIQNGQKGYVVVQKPQGMTMLMALPAEFEIVQAASGASYFAHQGTYYLPYLDMTGQEVYIVVDPPPPPPQAAPSPAVIADVSGTEMVERSVTIPAGTQFSIRIANDVSSETAQSGERFIGYLDTELEAGELLAAPRGSKVHGTVAEAQKAGSMSGKAKLVLVLTDLRVNGGVIPLVTNRYVIEGKSSSQDTGRKVVGGAGPEASTPNDLASCVFVARHRTQGRWGCWPRGHDRCDCRRWLGCVEGCGDRRRRGYGGLCRHGRRSGYHLRAGQN
jgi:hypothetical protein